MVQAQSVEAPLVDQSKDEGVRGLEDFRCLHSNGCECVHVEEAPVVNFFAGHTPESEPVTLVAEQLIKGVEARGDVL